MLLGGEDLPPVTDTIISGVTPPCNNDSNQRGQTNNTNGHLLYS